MSARKVFSPTALRSRRKQKKVSRDLLAFAVGRTVGTIGNYERGFTTPSAETIAALAHNLDCDPGDLFEAQNGSDD